MAYTFCGKEINMLNPLLRIAGMTYEGTNDVSRSFWIVLRLLISCNVVTSITCQAVMK